jgi:hypothetical protein
MRRATTIVFACALATSVFAAAGAQAAAETPPTIDTWPLCELIGPHAQRPGVYGTDLGFTFRHPYRAADGKVDERIVFFFGDTWPTYDSPCTEPPWTNDDTMATLRLADLPEYPPGPPGTGADAPRCPVLDFGAPDPLHDRPLRVLYRGRDLNMSYNRTPLAGWSDGRRPYGLFTEGDAATCSTDADCGAGQSCLRGELGRCTVDPCPAGQDCGRDPRIDEVLSAPVCRLDRNDCAAAFSPRRRCAPEPDRRGLCADSTGSMWVTGAAAHPADPDRRQLATTWVYVAVESAARPNVWETVSRFPTAKFVNPAARTVAAFDPDDPSRNDYRHGYDTLLIWGRPAFRGSDGAQALLYLLYNELRSDAEDASATGGGAMRWAPRYFAGYRADGRPRWSDSESDAAPLYASDFDVVNQIGLSWVEPLGAWVMLYGGDDTDGSSRPTPRAHEEPTHGAIHLRWAEHPWGAATRDAARGAWSDAFPLFSPGDAPELFACSEKGVPAGCAEGDPVRPIDFFRARMTGADCRAGIHSLDRGILYSANVIDELTRAVPASRQGGRAAELVWNVSVWNPYAVVLLKSRIELAGR